MFGLLVGRADQSGLVHTTQSINTRTVWNEIEMEKTENGRYIKRPSDMYPLHHAYTLQIIMYQQITQIVPEHGAHAR